jgi:hypothetical protein
MKIFMHWDMEGTSGLFTREHTWFWEEGARRRSPKRAANC